MTTARGTGITSIESLALGRMAAAASHAKEWRHDWYVSPFWSAETKRWLATIKPGFVGGECPVIRTTAGEQAWREQDFGINPLTGKPYFSAWVFEKEKATSAKLVDIPLYLNPALPLQWRKVGYDGAEGPPPFFASRGVANPQEMKTSADGTEALFATASLGDLSRMRLLRDCDIVLHQPRPALSAETQISNGIGTGVSNARQVLTIRPPAANDVLSVQTQLNFQPNPPPTIDPFGGVFAEPTYDELWLARVYVLSPRGTPPNSEPDQSWQPFVQHFRFYNLMWDRPYTKLAPAVENLTPYFLPLMGGLAQPLVNAFTAAINDAAQTALNALTGNSLRGYFWTATGGGHYQDLQPTEERKDFGLNKSTARAARERATRAARAREKLNPSFPYVADPFPTALLKQ